MKQSFESVNECEHGFTTRINQRTYQKMRKYSKMTNSLEPKILPCVIFWRSFHIHPTKIHDPKAGTFSKCLINLCKQVVLSNLANTVQNLLSLRIRSQKNNPVKPPQTALLPYHNNAEGECFAPFDQKQDETT